jgi:hypothetical protein
MRRTWGIASASFGVLSGLCFVGFKATPATLDANGVLHEPFGLIPLAYLCALLAVVLFGVACLGRK